MDRDFGQEDFMGRKIFRTKAELGGALVDIRKFVDVEESWQSKGHLNRHRSGNGVRGIGGLVVWGNLLTNKIFLP